MWILLVGTAFSAFGYLYNVGKAIWRGGLEGFVALHRHNTWMHFREPGLWDYLFYPAVIGAGFGVAYLVGRLARAVTPPQDGD